MSAERKDFDWRIWGCTFLAKDVPAAYPGGPSHKAGDPLFYSSLTRTEKGELIGFIQPRPAAMAINISISNALKANSIRDSLKLSSTITPHGKGLQISTEDTSHLFDYFECCMISVTFSVQSLDTFCNEQIEAYVKSTIPVKMNKKVKHLNKNQLQENLSLKMKIGTILPKIFTIPPPESLADKQIWNGYLELERVRNITVHLLSSDENTGVNIDKESLFFEFFKTDARKYPAYALDVMDYFKPKIGNKQWIDDARKKMG
ncbi:MAG: hypothetical protein PHT99_04305 [Methanoregula sp.]|nr:hypothetical protein [Methanoregula sp.]